MLYSYVKYRVADVLRPAKGSAFHEKMLLNRLFRSYRSDVLVPNASHSLARWKVRERLQRLENDPEAALQSQKSYCIQRTLLLDVAFDLPTDRPKTTESGYKKSATTVSGISESGSIEVTPKSGFRKSPFRLVSARHGYFIKLGFRRTLDLHHLVAKALLVRKRTSRLKAVLINSIQYCLLVRLL